MSTTRLTGAVIAALARTLAKRLIHGPLHPSWTLRVEILHRASRTTLGKTFVYGLPWMRALQNSAPVAGKIARRVRFEDVQANGVAARWCVPGDAGEPERTLVYFHGGGYVFGSRDSNRELVARIALAANARVLAVDYRLAPESHFPAAHDDCLAATRWVMDSGISPRCVAVGGDSAGAALSLATLFALRDAGAPLPAAAVLLCPWVDPQAAGGSIDTNEPTDIANRDFLMACLDRYMGEGDPEDPRVTPLRGQFAGLPPLLIQVGALEMVLDQSRELAARATRAGLDVTLSEYPGMFHVFQTLASFIPEAEAAINEIGDFLSKSLTGSQ